MNGLILFVGLVLILQVVLFFIIRNKRRQEKRHNVIDKYNIRTPADAFRLLQDQDIPQADRDKIERLYQGESDQ